MKWLRDRRVVVASLAFVVGSSCTRTSGVQRGAAIDTAATTATFSSTTTTNAPTAGSSAPTTTTTLGRPDSRSLFGMDHVAAEAEVRPGVWMALGRTGSEGVLGGAIRQGGTWAVRLRDVSSEPCTAVDHAAVVRYLSETTDVLVAACYDGGNAGDSTVIALGSPLPANPSVLLEMWCGHTDWTQNGKSLLITADDEGRPLGTTVLHWQGNGLTPLPGRLGATCTRSR